MPNNHATEINEIEEPPNISAQLKNCNNFIFSQKNYMMELLEEDKESSGRNEIEDEEVEEIICETL